MLTNGDVKTYGYLTDYERVLLSASFFKPHRSYVVNLRYVSELSRRVSPPYQAMLFPYPRYFLKSQVGIYELFVVIKLMEGIPCPDLYYIIPFLYCIDIRFGGISPFCRVKEPGERKGYRCFPVYASSRLPAGNYSAPVTMKLYPFITHLPVILFLILYCKRPPLISISSVLTAYLSCQIPKWIGSVTAAVTGKYFTEHLAYLVTMCIVYFLIKSMLQIR